MKKTYNKLNNFDLNIKFKNDGVLVISNTGENDYYLTPDNFGKELLYQVIENLISLKYGKDYVCQ